MSWPSLLLFVTGIYATVKLYRLSRLSGRYKFWGLLGGAFLFTVVEGAMLMGPLIPEAVLSGILEWGQVAILTLILCALALFVRESKPVFARFPLVYTMLPLLVLLSYYLVRDTYVLKEWLLSIYQGGALMVAALMYLVYGFRREGYGPVLTAVGLFGLTFAGYWFVPGVAGDYSWSWKIVLAASIVTLIWGYEQLSSRASSPETAGNPGG